MNSDLAQKVADAVDLFRSGDGETYVWRGLLPDGEEWKIMISKTYDDSFDIKIKQRGAKL